MKLTGLQIFKHLPGGKKEKEANCKKCGFPTCMAYAMKLAKGQASLEQCGFVSEELKAMLEEATQVQQAEIAFGPEENQVKVGNEIVMFRHDKKFVNEACVSVKLLSSDADFENKLEKITNFSVERVGEDLKVSAIALVDDSDSFKQCAKLVAEKNFPLILVSENTEKIISTLEEIKGSKPLVYLKNSNSKEVADLGQKYGVPIVASGSSLEEITQNSQELLDNKANNLVLNLKNLSKKDLIENLTYIRRSAIEQKFKPLGFPVIEFMSDIEGLSENVLDQSVWSSILLCKYSNIVVLEEYNEAIIYALLTLRQNIYTDPEKPLQIEAKVYPIGDVDENSPVLVTTNFALTYFSVATEVEASGIPVYLVITPSDGMSVLTAWSANKFTAEIIAKTFKEFEVDKLVSHREFLIPGYVGHMKEEIEEEMPEWKVLIGTNEAVEIVDHLRDYYKRSMTKC